jgi:integrase
MLIVQYWTGLRVGELLGLALNSLSNKIPDEIREPFQRAGFTVYGVILLDSQPSDAYIMRGEGGEIPRSPLKWRKEISPRNSRTIPVIEKEAWNILATRWKMQKVFFDKRMFGIKRENYLLFDGAQRNTYLAELRQTYEKLGLRFKGSHVLRHTRATEFTLKGIPEKLQELVLGHKGLAQQRYIHIVELLNKRAREDSEDIDIAV